MEAGLKEDDHDTFVMVFRKVYEIFPDVWKIFYIKWTSLK